MTNTLETLDVNVPVEPVAATAVQAALTVITMLPLIAVTGDDVTTRVTRDLDSHPAGMHAFGVGEHGPGEIVGARRGNSDG